MSLDDGQPPWRCRLVVHGHNGSSNFAFCPRKTSSTIIQSLHHKIWWCLSRVREQPCETIRLQTSPQDKLLLRHSFFTGQYRARWPASQDLPLGFNHYAYWVLRFRRLGFHPVTGPRFEDSWARSAYTLPCVTSSCLEAVHHVRPSRSSRCVAPNTSIHCLH